MEGNDNYRRSKYSHTRRVLLRWSGGDKWGEEIFVPWKNKNNFELGKKNIGGKYLTGAGTRGRVKESSVFGYPVRTEEGGVSKNRIEPKNWGYCLTVEDGHLVLPALIGEQGKKKGKLKFKLKGINGGFASGTGCKVGAKTGARSAKTVCSELGGGGWEFLILGRRIGKKIGVCP